MSELDRLTHLARAGRLSRRQFLDRAATLGVGAAAATSLFAKSAFAQETPQKGGDLVLGIDSADPSVPIASYVPLMMFAILFGLSPQPPAPDTRLRARARRELGA